MDIRKLPGVPQGDRVETGVIQFGDDWPGTFIRGDNSMAYGLYLAQFLKDPNDVMARCQMEGLLRLLGQSNINPNFSGFDELVKMLQPKSHASALSAAKDLDSTEYDPTMGGQFYRRQGERIPPSEFHTRVTPSCWGWSGDLSDIPAEKKEPAFALLREKLAEIEEEVRVAYERNPEGWYKELHSVLDRFCFHPLFDSGYDSKYWGFQVTSDFIRQLIEEALNLGIRDTKDTNAER